jgi:hypothetical protein
MANLCFTSRHVATDIASIGEAGNRAQSHLLAAARDHHRRGRFCTGFGSRIASSMWK